MTARMTLVYIIAVTAVLATSAGAIASGSDPISSGKTAEESGHLAVANGFAVLQRPSSEGNAAQVFSGFVSDPVLQELSIDWQAMVTASAQRGFTIQVVPARAHLCLISTSPETGSSLACGDAARVRDNGLFVRTGVADGTDTVVIGLVPDGIEKVGVVADTPSEGLVEHNTVVLESDASGNGRLRWMDGRGGHSVAMPPSPLQ